VSIRVVTDSSCDLPQALVDALRIEIVPLTIRFGDEELVDREELSTDEFWQRLESTKALPETAAPSAGAFEAKFRELLARGATGIVCINLSSRLSATMQAAQVAAAVRMQDKTGKKYLEFHQKLLSGRGQADKTRALAVAKEIGLDVAKIEKDMAGDEVKATIEESFKLAEALGLNGTPSYVVGTDVVIGAVGANTLKEKINSARCGKATC
jgi:predicted DsbA family dithiol-disulfide isomerase